jgi:hypothetical protein
MRVNHPELLERHFRWLMRGVRPRRVAFPLFELSGTPMIHPPSYPPSFPNLVSGTFLNLGVGI